MGLFQLLACSSVIASPGPGRERVFNRPRAILRYPRRIRRLILGAVVRLPLAVPGVVLAVLAGVSAVGFFAAPAKGQTAGPLVQWGGTTIGQATNAPAPGERCIAISASFYHSLAVRADGSLLQWGGTFQGQADWTPDAAGPYIAVATGERHNLALRAGGALVQWGVGATENAPSGSERFVTISAGRLHNLALRGDGSLVQWGSGSIQNPPAASERFIAIAAGRDHSLALRSDGSLVQWGTGSTQNAPASSERFKAIAAGWNHSLALRIDGSLVQWGDTSLGQGANAPSAAERFVAISAGRSHNLAIRTDGSLVQWGDRSLGQGVGAPPFDGPFGVIAAGTYHSLALQRWQVSSSSFSYQGRLSGATGPVDLRFALFDAAVGGRQVGAESFARAVTPDVHGVVTAMVEPGQIDATGTLWLEIGVAAAASGDFSTLAPRQPMTPTVRASFADRANVANAANSAAFAGTAGFATSAASATNAETAVIATQATVAASAPWSGLTGQAAVSSNVVYTDWQMVFNNASNTSYRGGIRLANSGFFEFTNSANRSNPSFARLDNGGVWTAASDARLKTDVTDTHDHLAAAMKLRPVDFRWKADGTEGFGLIAQEVRGVLPRLVTGDEAVDSLTVNYSQLSVVAIGAIQELKAENDAIRRENAELKARLAVIEAAVSRMSVSK